MALGTISDPNGLSQGVSTVVDDLAFTSSSSRATTITSTAQFPDVLDNEWIEIRNAVDTVNNGLYRVNDAGPTDSAIILEKVSGSDPQDATDTIDTIELFSHVDTNVADLVFENQAGRLVDLTSSGNALPAVSVGSRISVRNQADGDNNGVYEVTVVTTPTSDITVTKLDASTNDPNDAALDDSDVRTEMKSVMWDTAGLGCYVLEDTTAEGHLDLDGVLGQAFYSKAVIDWKDDNFLIANAPFPMLTIDSDAGKYLIGQDPSGNNSGWAPQDDGTYAVRTRKMFRNMGWSEVSSAGTLDAQYSGIRTLGAFLDETPATGDLAYYQYGTSSSVNDTVDFTFNGPVNEAILVYDGTATTASDFGITNTDTISRTDGGNWATDGYKVGGQIEIIGAEDTENDGIYVLTTVEDSADGDVIVAGTLTNNADDVTVHFAVDNRNAVTLRLRERTTPGDSNARTFSQADLAAAGESILSNRLFTFGLANSQDLDITESDANIDSQSPYDTMSITYYASGQSQGDGGGGGDGLLVGGPYDFSIVIDGNDGTNTEVYEWTQRQLRRTAVDADVDASTKIGRTLDGLMRFVGPTLQVGSVDGGLSFPGNPDGVASGVYIINLNSASVNDTVFYDDLETLRSAPLSVSVTLSFNTTLLDDAVAEYTLFFDYTRRRATTDLIITAGTGADGTFNSSGNGLTALNSGDGQYVRVSGLTGADEPMNGIYQVTTETSDIIWDVTRYDGDTIISTTDGTTNIDEYTIDSPDAIIVEDNTSTPVTGTDPSGDVAFSFDYSNNTQGGRAGSNDADVQCRAIGQETAQYTQSSVQVISTSAITIPVASQIERNFLNP
jgi:hypothetical protein